MRTEIWEPTNFYCSGRHTAPEGITVLGGKTGTTNEAGNCLIIYAQNSAGEPYISVVMGAPDRTVLYEQMDQMMTLGMAQ